MTKAEWKEQQRQKRLTQRQQRSQTMITPGSLSLDEEQALLNTLNHIDVGTKPTGKLGKKWGTTFGNKEAYLPSGSYSEYRVSPPQSVTNAGTRRIVVNNNTGEMYYTWTHYGQAGDPAFAKIR